MKKLKANMKYVQDFDDNDEEMIDFDQDIDDDQYLNMLKGNNTNLTEQKKQNVYDFTQDQKYIGQKRRDQQDQFDDQSIEKNKEETKINGNNNKQKIKIVKSSMKLKNQQKIGKQLSLDDELQKIEKEDGEFINQNQQNNEELKETALSLKEQLKLWKGLVQHRINYQKTLENVKRLPGPNIDFINQMENPSQINSSMILIVQNINNLLNARKQLYDFEGEDKINIPEDTNGFILPNMIELRQFCNQRCEYKRQEIEEDIIKWSQKTILLNNISKRQGLGGSLNFCNLISTPIGQVQKTMQNKDKLIQKSRLKRSIFRILGQGADDLATSVNPMIYDDTDFYLELLKEITLDQNDDEGHDMLTGTTQQYILQRNLQNQEKVNKNVDRKSSKARKLKFEQHQVLIQKYQRIFYYFHVKENYKFYGSDRQLLRYGSQRRYNHKYIWEQIKRNKIKFKKIDQEEQKLKKAVKSQQQSKRKRK